MKNHYVDVLPLNHYLFIYLFILLLLFFLLQKRLAYYFIQTPIKWI